VRKSQTPKFKRQKNWILKISTLGPPVPAAAILDFFWDLAFGILGF
jgi:hypothetical protein